MRLIEKTFTLEEETIHMMVLTNTNKRKVNGCAKDISQGIILEKILWKKNINILTVFSISLKSNIKTFLKQFINNYTKNID